MRKQWMFGLGLGLAGVALVVHAQDEVISNPPTLKSAEAVAATAAAPAPPSAPRLNLMAKPQVTELAPGIPREVALNLDIQYVNGWIRNPSVEAGGQVKYDKVSLRSYVQGRGEKAQPLDPGTHWGKPGATIFAAPVIEAYPGQTVRVTLNNNLPRDESCIKPTGGINTPHCFNGTNLHSHGLWINPAGNSDNVLISINPGVGFQYEYNLPPTHPAGTFWYHTHRHGSTGLQVSSGMAGALIVRGTRQPRNTTNGPENGDIDVLLDKVPERVLVFQQIQYACRFTSGELKGKIKTYGNDRAPGQAPDPKDNRYKCDEGDVGQIEGYDQLAPNSWANSGRYTSINGVVLGKMSNARAGRMERWRMIHGGVRDTIAFKIKRRAANAPNPGGLRAAQTEDYVKKYCTGPEVDLPLIAADGLTLAKVMLRKSAIFQPGYRWDALVVFPEAGDYCVVNDVTVASTVDRSAPSARLLGLVHADPGTAVPNTANLLRMRLVAAAKAKLSSSIFKRVSAELNDGLKLTSFEPHRSIAANEVTGTQELVFNIDLSKPNEPKFEVNGEPFDPSRIDRKLTLGAVDEWTLTSDFVSHPFHIHVNPFQIVSIKTPDGTDISGDDGKDPDGDDPQYIGMRGVWKDTLWVKNAPKVGKYTLVVRTRYERYIGDFVLHCHILDHEDQGMMQNVRISLPDGNGGTTGGHH